MVDDWKSEIDKEFSVQGTYKPPKKPFLDREPPLKWLGDASKKYTKSMIVVTITYSVWSLIFYWAYSSHGVVGLGISVTLSLLYTIRTIGKQLLDEIKKIKV